MKQDIIKKKQMDNQAHLALLELEKDLEFKAKNNKKYEIKSIINSAVYGQQVNDQMPSLYYFIL